MVTIMPFSLCAAGWDGINALYKVEWVLLIEWPRVKGWTFLYPDRVFAPR